MGRIVRESVSVFRPCLAFARAQWLETARFKSLWIYQVGSSFLLFAPLALTGMAFGGTGFEASGGGKSFLTYAVTGYVGLQVALSALWGGLAFLERSNRSGALPHVWSAEAPRWTSLVGVTVVDVGFAVFQAVLILFIASALFEGAAFVITPPSVAALLIAFIAFWGMGLVFAGVGLVARGARLPGALSTLAMVMAGVSFPIGILPWSVRWISYLNPYTYVLDLVRSTTLGTKPLLALEIEFAIGGVIALGSVVAGGWLFTRLERIAIRRGLVGLHA